MTTINPMPLRLYLIRHGETEWTLSGQHTGRTEIPLTARGEDEAKELGLRLRTIPFAHVLTSPRQRSRRTCELVGLAPESRIDPDLAEWDYGDYEAERSADIRKARADWNLFRDGCPHGEMPAQVSARADRLAARLRVGGERCAILARPIRVRPRRTMDWIATDRSQHFLLGTASISILGCNPHHPELRVIALWNAASHEMRDSGIFHRVGDKQTMKQQAIERWENEGGEIPGTSRSG